MVAIYSSLSLFPLLKPLIQDLYEGAKGKAKEGMKIWSTDQGIKRAAVALTRIDKVKTVWSPENEVSLRKFYYPSKLSISGRPVTVDNINDLPEGNIVIEGIVGQGKSMFMRHLALSLITSNPICFIPLLIELRTLSSKRNLESAILAALNTLSLPPAPETFEHLATTGRIVLLLDGFDEIPSEIISETIIEIEHLQFRHSGLKIIVSSRPRSHVQNVAGFQVLKLIQINPQDYDSFISKLVISLTRRVDVVTALNGSPANIKGIICTPLMLTLVVIVYQTEKQIPVTLSEFFEKLFGTVFSKHDRFKAGFNRQHHSGLSEQKLKQLFDAFCFMVVHQQGGRSLSSAAFESAFQFALTYLKDHKCELTNFRKDIVDVACLMVEEGFDTVTYLHKSILDYHAAAFVKSLPDAQAKNFYSNAFDRSAQWGHVLEFLKSIDPLRYARDYIIEFIPDLISELKEISEFAPDAELYDYLDDFMPGFSIKVHAYSSTEAGPLTYTSADFYGDLVDTLADCFLEMVDDAHSKEEVDKAIAITESLDNPGFGNISLWAAINVFDTDKVRKTISNYLIEATRNLEQTKRYLTEEKIKLESFTDILGLH
ncbi:NACHT domain-containing protein [Pseudomonas sp. SDO5532_S415]